jgi:cytidylate kinase
MSRIKPGEGANLDQLINRQMTLWDVRQKLARSGGKEALQELAHLQEGPWITLSREPGSGGRELAGKLAGRLGWQVFDRELLSAIAQHNPAREKLLSRLDEHAVDALQEFLSSVLAHERVSRTAYIHEVIQVVWTLARQGRAILVGRGANWLLDQRYGLRVRTVAPKEFRIARIARQRKIDPALARQALLREDQDVAAFIRQTFHREIDDPMGYDLILNLGTLDPEVAADTVVTTLRRKLGSQAGAVPPGGEKYAMLDSETRRR